MPDFEPTFASLLNFECPEWFRDAKFGIWAHWGPQSVPMYGDWYARNMYVEGSDQYRYHVRHYGHPSKFGYKDLCRLWTADKFDPDALMDLYCRAGARYFIAQATHHDNFFNYDSSVNRMNSVNVGPHRDICASWQKAAAAHGLPFGLSEHLAASFSWWITNKGADKTGPYAGVPYDGNDPAYSDFYYNNYEYKDKKDVPWLTDNPSHFDYWSRAVNEMIDRFTPDLLYSDSGLPFGDGCYDAGLRAVAHLYNASSAKYGTNRAVYTQKDRRPEIFNVGALDIEKSQLAGIQEKPWCTDTCVGNWFYDVRQVYKTPSYIIEKLIDVVSKNGTMLMNVLQRPDGTIDEWEVDILQQLGSWFDVCGGGIYGTRPWKTADEGESRALIQGFAEQQVAWTPSDYRFTAKGNDVYAFIMKPADDHRAVLRSFASDKVARVELLGAGEVEFAQNFGVLTVKLPEKLPTKYTNCLRITIEK